MTPEEPINEKEKHMEQVKWYLSPSKFESAKGCPSFEEDQRHGAEFKAKGTDLHSYMEDLSKPRDGLEQDDLEALSFCEAEWQKLLFAFNAREVGREISVQPGPLNPRAKLDAVAESEEILIVADWKFGVMPVPPVEENAQMRAYAAIAHGALESSAWKVMVAIIQPALTLVDTYVFSCPDDIIQIRKEMLEANARHANPFKQPDASDSSKCNRCKWITECPAVAGAVTRFVEQAALLPMPSAFEPSAIVSEPDRIIAQQLAEILEAWSEAVKRNNREYAEQNGGTLGGIWNMSTRSNGYEVEDVAALADALVQAEVIRQPGDLIPYLKFTKSRLVDGIAEATLGSKAEIAATVSEIVERLGVPRPPVTVFRKGGKKQVQAAFDLTGVPMLPNPFKETK